jgi:hypothetical protein
LGESFAWRHRQSEEGSLAPKRLFDSLSTRRIDKAEVKVSSDGEYGSRNLRIVSRKCRILEDSPVAMTEKSGRGVRL